MNQKTSKLIRNQILAKHGISPTVEVGGVTQKNSHYKKILKMVKKEYLATPKNKRAKFKLNGI